MENQRIPWRSFLPLLAFCLVGRAETPLSRQSLDLSALIEQSRAERAELSSYRTKPLPEVERAYDQAKRVVRFADDVRNYYRLRFATRKIDGVWRKLAVDAQGEPVNTYIDGIESLRRPPVTEFMYVMDGKGNFYLSHQIINQKHHSSLAGDSGEIAAAGMMRIENGRITYLDNRSGHYLPETRFLAQALAELERQGVSLDGVKVGVYGSEDFHEITGGRIRPTNPTIHEITLSRPAPSLTPDLVTRIRHACSLPFRALGR